MSELAKFAGNDYLGLAANPAIVEAMCEGAREYGVSSTSSRWAVGWTDVHASLERELADFMGSEDATITGSTFAGGPVYYGELAQMMDQPVVFLDQNAHTTHHLGVRWAGLAVQTYRHLDPNDLADKLKTHGGKPAIIGTDGTFSVSGEVAPVGELAELADRYGAELLVDDAHGLGVVGKIGRGASELAGVDPSRVTVLASMSKAMGCNGGFLAGRRALVEKFRRSAPANASAHPPTPIAAAARQALRIMQTEPEHRQRMEANARTMRQAAADAGVPVADDRHPIVALLFADEQEAADMSVRFREFGLWIPFFKYAPEPRHNMLRAAARAVHTAEQLDAFAEAMRTRPGR